MGVASHPRAFWRLHELRELETLETESRFVAQHSPKTSPATAHVYLKFKLIDQRRSNQHSNQRPAMPASQKPLSTSNVGKECHESRRWQCQNHGSGHHSQISPNKSLVLDARSIIFKSGDFTTSPNMEFINNRAALCRHSDKAFI